MLEASIIIVGDEILSGSVNDANGHLAAARFHSYGIPLTGVHVVPDDRGAIVGTLRTELGRSRPRIVLTTGGIGATHDDVTFAAIGEALDLELELASDSVGALDEELRDLEGRGFAIGADGREDALTMAVVPRGATVLHLHGWVCGALLEVAGGVDAGGATVIALPGVPRYFRAALDDVVVPALLEGRGTDQVISEVPHRVPELALSAPLRRLAERWPDVRIGSYPGEPMVVRVIGAPARVEAAVVEVGALLRSLEADADDRP